VGHVLAGAHRGGGPWGGDRAGRRRFNCANTHDTLHTQPIKKQIEALPNSPQPWPWRLKSSTTSRRKARIAISEAAIQGP
jgi:hypothetical protein